MLAVANLFCCTDIKYSVTKCRSSNHWILTTLLCLCVSRVQSVISKGVLDDLSTRGYVPITFNFSAQTSSGRTQEMVESKLEKKRKTVLGQ